MTEPMLWQSEYVAERDERLRFISGFSGHGVAVVTESKAVLWTDDRYNLQADYQLDCEWLLMGHSPVQVIWGNKYSRLNRLSLLITRQTNGSNWLIMALSCPASISIFWSMKINIALGTDIVTYDQTDNWFELATHGPFSFPGNTRHVF